MLRSSTSKALRSPTLSFTRNISGKAIIQEGDVVLLRRRSSNSSPPILTAPLRKDGIIRCYARGPKSNFSIESSQIIGKRPRNTVQTTKGDYVYRILEPTLAEYIRFSPRLVTPIYPNDAALIVNLLDLHPTSYTAEDDGAPLEIFEAGTGHGSLTLHLSRAIHAANSRPPPIPPVEYRPNAKKSRASTIKKTIPSQIDENRTKESLVEAEEPRAPTEQEQPDTDLAESHSQIPKNATEDLPSEENNELAAEEQPETNLTEPHSQAPKTATENLPSEENSKLAAEEPEENMGYTQDMRTEYEQWLTTRRAVIQTLDISAKYSEHAQRLIRSYRRGQYYPNINFHVGTIAEYISARLEKEQKPFLQHAILDLPQTHTHMELIGKALKPNGFLLLFCPNITQINDSVQLVKKLHLPFFLDNVLEIGGPVDTGGREWTVKMMKARADVKEEEEAEQKLREEKLAAAGDSIAAEDGQESPEAVEDGQDIPEEGKRGRDLTGWNMVCHPSPGVRTTVGAFIAIWRRMET